MTSIWKNQHLYFEGDEYFADLLSSINAARHSIWIEVYIFDNDQLGTRIASALIEAARRGIKVHLLIDAVGCLYSKSALAALFKSSGVLLSVYHPLPFSRQLAAAGVNQRARNFLTESLRHMFRRNHRKIAVVDEEVAWIGGMNFCQSHCRELAGTNAWRDTAIRVSGPGIATILATTSLLWLPILSGSRAQARKVIRSNALKPAEPEILLNASSALGRRRKKILLRRVQSAKTQIFVTSAYFIPTRRMRAALHSAALRGVDVRILVPTRADVLFMPWAAHTFYAALLKVGVRVFEYFPRMLHAKTLIIDDWSTIGTSNFNHRSFHRDLEIDLVITETTQLQTLQQQFDIDLEHAHEITEASLAHRPFWQRLLGRLALLFKSQL